MAQRVALLVASWETERGRQSGLAACRSTGLWLANSGLLGDPSTLQVLHNQAIMTDGDTPDVLEKSLKEKSIDRS